MKNIILITAIISLACFCYADEELILVGIIDFPDLDKVEIFSINNVGDFNADGYDDLLIGFRQNLSPEWYEAAYLYYGGPSFDYEPDLVFYEDQQGQLEPSGFGFSSCKLGDFNGDGINDIAISEPARGFFIGRINIYFGLPEPDTIADLRIYGEWSRDYLGKVMITGDFNNDGLGDLFTRANGYNAGARLFIYLGSQLPDPDYDFIV